MALSPMAPGAGAVVLGAQAYVAAFHAGAVVTHRRIDHHPAAGVAPGFFILLAFSVTALRTNVLVAVLGTALFAGVGWLLGVLLVRPEGWVPLINGGRGA